jgi:ELWxxDGT repeat protein
MHRFALAPKLLLIAFLLAFAAPGAFAQAPHPVADVNTAAADFTDSLFTSQPMAALGANVYFLQDDGVHGVELWKSDGTAAGTAMLKDICPGACYGRPYGLTVWNGALYFGADDGVHGYEPWKSDGTAAGTAMIADLYPGLNPSSPTFFAAGGVLYMAADDGVHGAELWKTDGSVLGTVMIQDIHPGAAGSSPRLWLDLGGKLVLNADDGVHGREPWLSDGTPGGTAMIADLDPGVGDSTLTLPGFNLENDALALGDGTFVFEASDGVHGYELWRSDGTAANTAMVADLEPGAGDSQPHGFARLGTQVLFGAFQSATGFELWTTDGTAAHTALLKDIAPGSGSGSPQQLTPLGGFLYFAGNDGVAGRELWRTDGTAAGTVLVKDVNPNNGPFFTQNGFNFFARVVLQPFAGGLLFFADDGTHGVEPWKTDGTAAGTVMVKDVSPGSGWGVYRGGGGIVVIGATAYFQGTPDSPGTELWKTDGTAAGTVEVKDAETLTSAFHIIGNFPNGNLRALAGKLAFDADDGLSGSDPWITDGTSAGTLKLADLQPGPLSGGPTQNVALGAANLLGSGFGLWATDGTLAGTAQLLPGTLTGAANLTNIPALGVVLFAGKDSSGDSELWTTDGTPGGTSRVLDIRPGLSSDPASFTPLGSIVLFTATDGTDALQLWRTGGTAATTVPLTGGPVNDPLELTVLGSKALFGCNRQGMGQELCATDGTGPGTVFLKDILPGTGSGFPQRLVPLGSVVVFHATDDTHGRELWVSDGTPAGTALLKDILPGTGSGTDPYPMWNQGDSQAVFGGNLFFIADDGVHGRELWKTDGTAAGTVLVKDIYPGARSSDIDWMVAASVGVYFVADDGVHGRELWTSDGTAAGTHLAKDLVAGAGSPVIQGVRSFGHLALFSADDGVHGRELWRSDGVGLGTFQVADIAPGAAPSNPLEFTPVGSQVYFTANDGVTGNEVWSVPSSTLLATFGDVPANYFAWRFIEALAIRGVTGGCGGGNFCPGLQVNRAEAAVFLLAARGDTVPPATGTRFQDVPINYFAAPWIEELAREGIVSGCSVSPPLYCPSTALTRAQMAVMVVGGRHETPSPATGTRFADVPASYWAARWIEQLAADGITGGCGGGNFCPDQPLTRAEMAVFLTAAFHLPLP